MGMARRARDAAAIGFVAMVTTACLGTSAGNVEIDDAPKALALLAGETSTRQQALGAPAPAATPTPTQRGRVVVSAVGDVNLDPSYVPGLSERGYDDTLESVRSVFRSDDITIVNLECTASDLGTPVGKRFSFRCPTESLPALADAGVEVANIGNNHSGDHGPDALVDSRHQLESIGVAPVGAGIDATQAALPALFHVNGWVVAVLGFGGVLPSPTWLATDERPGMADGDDIASMTAAVRAADTVADIVLVTVHWGTELATVPDDDDVARAEALVEAGADAIFGHHSHRLQPLDRIADRPVAWSLGNFVWPSRSAAAADTAIARVVIEPDGEILACLLPVTIVRDGHPALDDPAATTCPDESATG